jgi:hypothetical protein
MESRMSVNSEQAASAHSAGFGVRLPAVLMIIVALVLLLWLADRASQKSRVAAAQSALSKTMELNKELSLKLVEVQKRAARLTSEENSHLELLQSAGAAVRVDVVDVHFGEDFPTPSVPLFEGLTQFHYLQSLTIRSPGVSPLALRAAGQLPQLRYLFLSGDCLVNADAELTQLLKGLPNLKSLELAKASFAEETWRQISRSKTLRLLSLSKSAVTDNHVEILSECEQLEILYLDETLITDLCVPYLLKMKRLREIRLPATISQAAEAQLTNALPGCSVYIQR